MNPDNSESWYRNAGYFRKYHKPASDWLVSGKAICGRDIHNPAFVRDKQPTLFWDKLICKKCLNKLVGKY